MKTFFKTLALSAVTLAFLAPNAAKAEEVSPEPQEAPVLLSGDGVWTSLGTWTMKSAIYFVTEDGGDLKACVKGTDKVQFTLKHNVAPWIGTSYGSKTTSGVSGDNCTGKWTGLSIHAPLVLYKDNFNSVDHTVTVYD